MLASPRNVSSGLSDAIGEQGAGKRRLAGLFAGRLALLAASALPAMAAAQEAPRPDVAGPTRQEINPPAIQAQTRPSTAKVSGQGAITVAPCPLETSAVRATITRVAFSGAGGEALAPELNNLLAALSAPAGEQPISVVCAIRDQANAALRRERYVATIQIPPQRIEDGVLKLEVVTSRIVEMRVRGEAGPYEGRLQQSIEALKRLDPLNEAVAEKILLLAGDVPGLDVQLSLRPTGAKPGDVIGELTVNYSRFSVVANAQNYNSKQLGRETGYVRAEIRGLTGLSDTTYFGFSTTANVKEQKIFQIGHIMGLDDKGTTIGARLTYAISQPDLDQLRLQTKSIIASLEVSRPLIRSVRDNLGVVAGFEFAQQRTVVQSAANDSPLNLDRVTTAYVRLAGETRSFNAGGAEQFRLGGSLEVRKGLGIFGATKTGQASSGGFFPSRFEGSATATVLRGQLDERIGLGPIFSITGSQRGQWSNRPLLNYDEFAIGNLTLGRGYDPGSNSGDRALGASVELRAMLPQQSIASFEPFVFFDAVRIWNLDRNSTENNRLLRSYGGGLRIALPGIALLELTYARPVDKALSFDDARPNDRVLASLTFQLVPFGGRR
ncbi:ShlB/FhaC/HecB family hemolysin secretion/activation protein [Novosphingobium sp. Chol11]|uniref:ShlB/FhaC/HecB family hemolysin secretion/activation protein n=1 Tax=Novosphingobium sp. Chol11 TaxID=1385763 RepID=UPI0025F3BA2B|nr:ShlB/FhaC/HecB family hemolysin secretion/activation protein [Novosphingobium sp. Chol11]